MTVPVVYELRMEAAFAQSARTPRRREVSPAPVVMYEMCIRDRQKKVNGRLKGGGTDEDTRMYQAGAGKQ